MNIFLINGTPLQLMIANELKSKLNICDEESILAIRKIKNDPYKFSIKDLEEVASYGSWKQVHFIAQRRVLNFVDYFRNFLEYSKVAKRIFKHAGQVERLILGNYGNEPMRHVANTLGRASENIIFLDEGSGTIQLYEKRSKWFVTGNELSPKTTDVIKKLFGLVPGQVEQKISFFTQFDLKPASHTNIIQNDFALLKSQVNTFNRVDEVWVLGNPFPEKGYCDVDTYISWLSIVASQFSGKRIVYVAHPREQIGNLNNYAARLKFTIVSYELPFELQMLQLKTLPIAIASFVSTAFINSFDLFGSKTNHYCFEIPTNDIKKNVFEIAALYRYLKSINNKLNFTFITIHCSVK